ncbi:MAG TPA: hypothetical protein VFY56_14545, partial [Propionibacteriaceae bacterium]|nr:hypothetical protein [Propionibacteriaceae bacterium]
VALITACGSAGPLASTSTAPRIAQPVAAASVAPVSGPMMGFSPATRVAASYSDHLLVKIDVPTP